MLDAPLSFMSYDIEVLTPEDGTFPKSSDCPITIISLAFEPAYKGRDTLVLAAHSNTDAIVYKGLTLYEKEEDLLEGFLDIVEDYDPDIMESFNGSEFDNQYISDRMNICKVYNNISRNKRSWYGRFAQEKTTWTCQGRIILDLLPLVRKHLNPTEYKALTVPLKEHNLRYVAKNFLKLEKLDMKPSEMRSTWLGPDWLKMIIYAERDAVIVGELRREMQVLDKYIALSKASGALLQDILNGGQSTMIDNLMLRKFREVGRVAPMKPKYEEKYDPTGLKNLLDFDAKTKDARDMNEEEDEDEVKYAGGMVLIPIIGMHQYIIIMDFASLYPSIMRAFNLSPDTIYYIDGIAKFRMDFQGIVPNILEELYNNRVEFKREMKQTTDKDLLAILNLKQYAMKILLNSIYGYFGFSKSRLYEMSIAAKVTEEGRKALMLTKKTVEAHKGCVIVAGDTDSVMFTVVGCETFDQAREFAGIIHNEMLELLPKPMSLAFESFGARGIFQAKKRYAVYITEDGKKYKVKARGIEIRRRDWCSYTEETLTNVFDILLKEGDIMKAGEYAKSQVDRIAKLQSINDDPELISKLLLSKKFSKPIEQYKTKTMHIGAIQRALNRKETTFQLGDRILFYVVDKKTKKTCDCTEVAEYVIEKGLKISKEYYLNKQLIPPLNRIFKVLKYNYNTSLYISKQKTLFEY